MSKPQPAGVAVEKTPSNVEPGVLSPLMVDVLSSVIPALRALVVPPAVEPM